MTTLDLPPDHGPARDEAILSYIRAGDYTAELRPVTSTHKDKTATFFVFPDALKIRGVRVNASAKLLQTIADMLGCSLLTPKIADLAWMAGAALPRHVGRVRASLSLDHAPME